MKFIISKSTVLLVGASIAALGAPAASTHAGVTPIGVSAFGPGSTTVTFSELPIGTAIPFTIGIADFVGLSATITNIPLGAAMPPSTSRGPYLYTGSVGDEDVIDITFDPPQMAVGAYFNIQGGGMSFGEVELELYADKTLLGTVSATPVAGTFGGFVGGNAGLTIVNRAVFRDVDLSTPVSFRIDDLKFKAGVPADLNGDGVVNGMDLAILLAAWTGGTTYAPCPPPAPADLNGDCKINGLDLAILLAAWG